jgi:hypothetical protein
MQFRYTTYCDSLISGPQTSLHKKDVTPSHPHPRTLILALPVFFYSVFVCCCVIVIRL